jgi:hypothetical protein
MEAVEFDKKRYRVKNCPCGKSNRDGKFVPYVGFENKGFCHSCGETFLPANEKKEKDFSKSFSPIPSKPISFIDSEILKASLRAYDKNNFVSFLKSTFGEALAMKAVETYKIGTSKARHGANVFWYIDNCQKVRGGKIMLYDPSIGKRKDFFSWTHSRLKLTDFNLKRCFFGDHLLESNPFKNIGIVESEKTAIISSLIFPDMIWLASGGKNGLDPYKFESLRNRTVFLFPDLTKPADKETCFELWSKDLVRIKGDVTGLFEVSDYFESRATDEQKELSLDLADFILLNNWRAENAANAANAPFEKPFIFSGKNDKTQIIDNEHYISHLYFENGMLMNEMDYPADWDLVGSYTEQRTKDFIRMAIKNPLLIGLRKQFELV